MEPLKELTKALVARVRAPIFGYFVISFCVYNWYLILYVCTSEDSAFTKSEIWNKRSNIVWPLIVSLAGVIALPYIQVTIAWLTRRAHELLISQKYNTLLHEEESKLTLKSARDEVLSAEIKELRLQKEKEELIAQDSLNDQTSETNAEPDIFDRVKANRDSEKKNDIEKNGKAEAENFINKFLKNDDPRDSEDEFKSQVESIDNQISEYLDAIKKEGHFDLIPSEQIIKVKASLALKLADLEKYKNNLEIDEKTASELPTESMKNLEELGSLQQSIAVGKDDIFRVRNDIIELQTQFANNLEDICTKHIKTL